MIIHYFTDVTHDQNDTRIALTASSNCGIAIKDFKEYVNSKYKEKDAFKHEYIVNMHCINTLCNLYINIV